MWSGLIKKTDDAFAVLDAAGYTYEVEGFFWGMGGGDARNRNSNSSDPAEVLAGEQEALARSAQYGENLTNFIAAVRDRYAADLPFVMNRIKDDLSPELLSTYPGADLVRQGQLDVAASDPWTEAFSSEGISLRDNVHFDAAGQIEFGTRFANGYSDLLSANIPPSISISDATIQEQGQLGTFVTEGSGGLQRTRHMTIGPGQYCMSSASMVTGFFDTTVVLPPSSINLSPAEAVVWSIRLASHSDQMATST